MPDSRFTRLEIVMAVLAGLGGVAAIGGDRIGNESVKTIGIALLFAAAIVFGLDMIVQKRADIGTRYTSSINPSFHVFRGPAAVAWGISYIAAGAIVVLAAVAWLRGSESPRGWFGEHRGLFIALAGLFLTARALGNAGRATRRISAIEQPARRGIDRFVAIVVLLPLGLLILGWGLFEAFAELQIRR